MSATLRAQVEGRALDATVPMLRVWDDHTPGGIRPSDWAKGQSEARVLAGRTGSRVRAVLARGMFPGIAYLDLYVEPTPYQATEP